MKQIFNTIKKDIIKFTILTILLSIVMVSEAYLMQLIIDSIKLGLSRYIIIIILVIVFLIAQTILYYFQQSLTAIISKKSAYEYRKIIFKNIQRSPIKLIMGDKNSMLLASLTAQIDQIEYNYFYSIYWGFYLICQLTVAIIISLYFNPLMAILTIILSLPNLLVAVAFKKHLEKRQEQLIESTNYSTSKVQDIIEGICDWKVSNADNNILKLFEKITSKLLNSQIKVEKSQYIVVSLNQLFSNVLYFGSWIIGGLLIMNNKFTLGALIAFSQLLVRISYPVYASSDLLAKYISGKRIIIELNKEFLSDNEAKIVNEKIDSIKFINFIFRHDLKEEFPFNYSFYKNKKYLLKGKSGSGKTTILKAIIREYDDYKGNIIINNDNIRNIEESSIFNNIAYVAQNPHLFSATLRDNLTLFSDLYTDEQIFEALNFVELSKWANEKSLDKVISNDTMKISGGEIKRVALARAMLMNKDILLLDEFSSGIDYQTLTNIENKLLKLNKMIIYITHMDTNDLLDKFDEFIDLDNHIIKNK